MKLKKIEKAPVRSGKYGELIKEFDDSDMQFAEVVLDDTATYRKAYAGLIGYTRRHRELNVQISSEEGRVYLRKEVWG